MRKSSTLIYFINRIHSKSKSAQPDLIEKRINEFLSSEITEQAPSDNTIENILNFARSYDVCKTKSAGIIEMILN